MFAKVFTEQQLFQEGLRRDYISMLASRLRTSLFPTDQM